MDCLELGASDFVTKPSGSESANLATVASQLVEFLQAYGRQYQLKKQATSGIKTSPATLAPHYIHTPHLQTAPQTHTAVSGTSVFAVSPEEAENRCKFVSRENLKLLQLGFQPEDRMPCAKCLRN